MADFSKARAMLSEFKGDNYIHGLGVLPEVGKATAKYGRSAALIADHFPGSDAYIQTIRDSLAEADVDIVGEIDGAGPNAPLEDLARITERDRAGPGRHGQLRRRQHHRRGQGGRGVAHAGRRDRGLLRHGSGDRGAGQERQDADAARGHPDRGQLRRALTKYSNITDVSTGQKKLIVDEAIVPVQPVFDYEVTFGAPVSLTADGALDGIAHSLEVLYGAVGKPYYERMEDVAVETIGLVLEYLPKVMENPEGRRRRARHWAWPPTWAATPSCWRHQRRPSDQLLAGGRAEPRPRLRHHESLLHGLLLACHPGAAEAGRPDLPGVRRHGRRPGRALTGRELGEAVAEAMIHFEERIGFPPLAGARLHRCAYRACADRGQEPAAQDEAGEHARAADRRHGGRVHGPGAGGGEDGRSVGDQDGGVGLSGRPAGKRVAQESSIIRVAGRATQLPAFSYRQ